MLPEPPKAFYWNWLSIMYKYGFYNPFFRNTKDKLVRFVTSFRKSKEQREWEQMGYFGRFIHQTMNFANRGAQSSFNPFSRFSGPKSFIKRRLIYYGSILLGLFLLL